MIEMNVVEEVQSDYALPVVLVMKPDGSERFCEDYRGINAKTVKDLFPMSNIESKLNKLHGCKLFTTLDEIGLKYKLRKDKWTDPLPVLKAEGKNVEVEVVFKNRK